MQSPALTPSQADDLLKTLLRPILQKSSPFMGENQAGSAKTSSPFTGEDQAGGRREISSPFTGKDKGEGSKIPSPFMGEDKGGGRAESLPSPRGRGAGGEGFTEEDQAGGAIISSPFMGEDKGGGRNEAHLLFQRSERHGVSALLYWHWRHNPTAIPQQLLLQCQQAYIKNLARFQIIHQDLASLINLLTSQGIQITLLKGAVFSRTLYPDPALRPMTDIDILIHENQLPLAIQTMKTAGYEDAQLILNQQDFIERSHHILFKPPVSSRPDVELHWRLIAGDESRFLPSMEWFHKQITPWNQDNPLVYSLNPTASLLFACAHLALQHGIGLAPYLWYIDIALLLEKQPQDIDWQELIAQAQAWQWSAAVYYTLIEVESIFDVHPPSEVMQALKANITPFEASYIQSKSAKTQNVAMLGWDIMISLSWRARLKTIFSHLFPLPSFMRERYNISKPWLLPFYYPYRWYDMTIKLISAASLRRNKPRTHTN